MRNEELVSLSIARFDHSVECISEAQKLFENEMYNGAANRAYYASRSSIKELLE